MTGSTRIESPGRPRPHAVIIGAGLGGLAAAIRLGARGYRVTILEQLDGPGGRAYVFRQDGFTFDAGPTIITAAADVTLVSEGLSAIIRDVSFGSDEMDESLAQGWVGKP